MAAAPSANARAILRGAEAAARDCGALITGTEHLLMAIVHQRGQTADWLVRETGKTEEVLVAEAQSYSAGGGAGGRRPQTPSMVRGLALARQLAVATGGGLQSEQLLLGVLLAADAQFDGLPNAAANICDNNNDLAVRMEGSWRTVDAAAVAAAVAACAGGAEEFGIDDSPAPAIPVAAASAPRAAMPADYRGPTPDCHWVSENLLCGKSPGRMSDDELRALVDGAGASVDVFVCLQTSYDEYDCADYPAALRRLKGTHHMRNSREICFVHCPVPDFGVLSEQSLLALTARLRHEMDAGCRLYVHCMGGHGRTGTVVANLIESEEGCSFAEAMQRLRRRHAGRVGCRGGGHCALSHAQLEDPSQTAQAERVEPAMARQHKIHE